MRYFAYGSNMDAEQMKERGIIFSERKHAILGGWKLVFNKVASKNPKEGKANIIPDKNSFAEGLFYEIDDISKLDIYEGYPKHYGKKTVTIQLDNGKELEAIVYVAQPDKERRGLKPTKEYIGHLLKGCDLLSEQYCRMLKEWETLSE